MKARKDKALAPNILENMTMAVTLSDRLRQAGIRECETNSEIKIGNLGQSRKIQSKRGLAQKCNERNKKLQNLGKEFYSPDSNGYYQTPSRNCGSFSKALRRKIKGSAKKTIFASLDFIKDCQKYKKKVINPEKHLKFKRERKSESIFSNLKQNLYIKKEPQKLHASKTYSQIPLWDNIKEKKGALTLNTWKNKEGEKQRTDPLFFDQNTEKLNITDEKKYEPKKQVSKTSSHVKPFFDKFPSGDIVKIDKKYLQSLLSITKTKYKICINDDQTKSTEEAIREKQNQKKEEKKANEVSSENKIRIKKSDERGGAAEETTQIPSFNKSVLAKNLRDSTKSEAQIFVHKNKFHNQRSSEMKSEKNVANIKPEVNDTRKNRKNRNKLLKNKNGKGSHLVFPNEIPIVIDIKELWRREVREKSENSLSSDSSCTVSKNDMDPEQKNSELKSYKLLKKFVEEEVKKMSNESKKQNYLKESGKVENICKKLNTSTAENLSDEIDIFKNEMSPLKKKLMQIKHPKHYSVYEGEKINSTLLNTLDENKLKDHKKNRTLLKEKDKGSEKTPSRTIKNWSILNRLEQAFLVLGTPNFQGKNLKNSKSSFKGQELDSKEKISIQSSRKNQNYIEKIDKELQKSKATEGKKGNSDASNTPHSTIKTSTQSSRNKKFEVGGQRNLIKDNQQRNKFKKELKNDNPQNNIPLKISEYKKIITEQEKKKNFNQTTQENIKKKLNVRSADKPNVNVHEPKQLGRKKDKKPSSRNNALVKKNESCKKKLSKAIVQNKNSSQSLQKKTFHIYQKGGSSIVQPRKSKSCDKIDDNFKLDNMKISFSQIKNQELKKKDFFHKNKKDKPQSKDKNMKNETETTETATKSFIPQTSAKVPFKTKPEYHEDCKCSEVKEFLEVSRKSSEEILDNTTNQEKLWENEKEIEEQGQDKKLLNNPSERVIKERSVLSMSGKQQNSQKSLTILLQTEGKNVSDIYPFSQTSNSESSEIEKSQNDLRSSFESPIKLTQKISSSAISKMNISNVSLTDSNSTSHQTKIDIDRQECSLGEFSKKLSSSSDFSSNNSIVTKQASEVEMDKIPELNFPKCQTKTLWEQDTRHYNALVKEIMSHYNRINGFLTHSDYLQSFTNDSAELLSIKNSTDADSMPNKSLKMNLHEYRKRIISEYQAFPIFEYKKLLQEKKEENLLTKEAKKRNLTVVKDVTTEMDLDVKDFQPKIQRVLDSQLYVDVENLIRRNHPKVKFREKKSSLQEIVLNENEKKVNQKCLRASSTTKTFSPLPSSSDCVESFQKLKTIKSFHDDLTEMVTSTSMEETESEF